MATPAPITTSRRLIAPWYHTVIFLVIQGGLAWWGVHVNKVTPSASGAGGEQHGQALIYAANIGGEWLMFYFILVGVHDREGLRGRDRGKDDEASSHGRIRLARSPR